MTIQILAFGIAKEIFGKAAVPVPFREGMTVDDLKVQLEQQYPRLKELASYMVAVQNAYVHGGEVIQHDDEIALIPPVSGG